MTPATATVRPGAGGGFLLGLLACDHVTDPVLVDAARGRDYTDMYADLLRAAAPSIGIRVYDVVGGELPGRPDECDGWLVTGARYDAYADAPWIVALREFVVGLHARRIRTVGVCFGHQVIAHALGGRAEPAGSWRAGPHLMTVESTEWFDGGDVAIHAMHQDVVSVLPAGARPIATGTTAEHPAFVVDDVILCVQDHPEFDAGFVAALVEHRRDRLGDDLADESLDRIAGMATHGDVVGRWIADFLLDRRP